MRVLYATPWLQGAFDLPGFRHPWRRRRVLHCQCQFHFNSDERRSSGCGLQTLTAVGSRRLSWQKLYLAGSPLGSHFRVLCSRNSVMEGGAPFVFLAVPLKSPHASWECYLWRDSWSQRPRDHRLLWQRNCSCKDYPALGYGYFNCGSNQQGF
jgi:hypothetical protein